MTELTTKFAIGYLLDDCADCPESKDGKCMTQSHCFEVKQLAIKALKQMEERGENMTKEEAIKRDLKKVTEELTAEYNKAIENDYVFKPMAYTLYHLWKKWDAKEHSRISNTRIESEG